MNKWFKIFLVLLPILLLGMMFQKNLDITARFDNIDHNEEVLKLRFEIKDRKTGKVISPNYIGVRNNDSLIMSITSDSNVYIDHWEFPSVPKGFKITYPQNADNLPQIKKADNLQFYFSAHSKYSGSWVYKSYFSSEKLRWMFDDAGNQVTVISCNYERWIGKDIIRIEANQDFQVCDSSFMLSYVNGDPLEFSIKHKRNPKGSCIEANFHHPVFYFIILAIDHMRFSIRKLFRNSYKSTRQYTERKPNIY